MAHQLQLENRKYRNWVKAATGFKYTKDGLEPFCDLLVQQQHVDILNKVKHKHSLKAAACEKCDIKTLQPDHVRTKATECPLRQKDCNCLRPGGKTTCSVHVCSAIYDEIFQLHASSPPSPNWKNTDAKHWCTEPWAVAKCFINAAGYENKLKASEFDCSGLLHILKNNFEFRHHLNCATGDPDELLKTVLSQRNKTYHSEDMELEDEDVTTYIDDMIALLQDDKELINMACSKAAVDKLKALKREDFVITTTHEADILRAVIQEAEKRKRELEQIGEDVKEDVKKDISNALARGNADLTTKGKEVNDKIVRTITEQIRYLYQRELYIRGNINNTVVEGMANLTDMGKQIESDIVIAGSKQIAKINQTVERETKIIMKDATEKGMTDLTKTKNLAQKEIMSTAKDVMDEIGTMDQKEKWDDIDHRKAQFQKRLVENYLEYTLTVSPLPLQPEKIQTDINEVYVSPWMTVEEWDATSKRNKETEISLNEIFNKKEKPSKYIYILGEAGSGKSALCKCLVYYWCVAHSERTSTTTKSEVVKEMENYDFLFYISLRHFSDLGKIEAMLNETYPDPILSTVLQTKSDKCLILLDGLDEWTTQNQRFSQFLTKGLPRRDLHAKYTIITTTRRWKFDSLKIPYSEMHKKINLKGIAKIAIKDLTKTTIKILNETFQKNKAAEDFELDLQRSPVADISHIPLILQQLICLWFDGKLQGTSKCSVYSSMLALFFDWKALRHSESQVQTASGLRLPEYLCKYRSCYDNTSVIYYLARLAYKTLLTKYTKETLIFSNSTFQQLKFPDDVKLCSLNAGILSEYLNKSVFAGARQHSSFSFVHRSMQEFLAAVHIAMQLEKINISCVSRKENYNFEEKCKYYIGIYFRSCKTAADILKQSNVFIMLCGLEPKLLPYITEYIFSVIKVDKDMIEERNHLQENRHILHELLQLLSRSRNLTESIQICVSSCIKETSLDEKIPKNSIHIADILLTCMSLFYLHKYIFNLHSVVCLDIQLSSIPKFRELDAKFITDALEHLSDIDGLKVFKCKTSNSSNEQLNNQVAQIISRNKTTLERVSLIAASEQTVNHLVQIIPDMSHLISIQIETVTGDEKDISRTNVCVSHEIYTSLCTYLEQSVHLQTIKIAMSCRKNDEHSINLAQHKQLQCFSTSYSNIVVTSLNTNSLNSFVVVINNSEMINQLCDSIYNARKLEELIFQRCKPLQNAAQARSDTENLIRLLPSLTSLSIFGLDVSIVTDNILACPLDMKSLKIIVFLRVAMSMTTWCKFVDSLTALPHIPIFYCDTLHIIDTTHSIENLIENEESSKKARQYLKEKFDGLNVGWYFAVIENCISSII